VSVPPLENELRAIVAAGGPGAPLDALGLLADGHGLRSAALWELGFSGLVRRDGFGGGDERPLPRELWGPDLQRAVGEGGVSLVPHAPAAWSHGDRPHVLVPILADGTVIGIVIATADVIGAPEVLGAQCRALAPLLRPQGEALERVTDALEPALEDVLLGALEEVRSGTELVAERAADALRSAHGELRAATAALRGASPRAESLAEAITRCGELYGLIVEQDLEVSEEQISPEERTVLAGIIREALENAAVHGRAHVARVSARQSRSGIRLVFEDDGGVSPAEGEPASLRGGPGLAAIEGHAAWLHGSVTDEPSERGGVRLEVTLPEGRRRS